MFTSLSRYSKAIAWFFTGVLYLELLLTSVDARAHYVVKRETINVRRETAGLNSSSVSPLTSDVSRTDNKQGPLSISGVELNNPQHETRNPQPFIGGPTQPEMQSFSSVNANNMVNLFTGDFSYNIPLLDVGGYPVNIHYNSGITMDEEASWVGLGWNINPGTVSRNMRGLPDDFSGDKDQVTKTLHVKDNRTIGLTFGFDFELFGLPASVGINTGAFHNNYRGWGQEVGIGVTASFLNSGKGSRGGLTAGLSVNNNSQTGLNIMPSLGVTIGSQEERAAGSGSISANYNSRAGIQNLQITGELKRNRQGRTRIDESTNKKIYEPGMGFGGGLSSSISFSRPSYTPSIAIPYTSRQLTITGKIGGEVWGLDVHGMMSGSGSIQYIEKNDVTATHPAYGYLYYQNSIGNDQALLDFNREKDVTYTEKSPHIAVPVYTYDTWSITGEGTGGMFRAYRGDIGFVHDHKMVTKSDDNNISTDFAFGGLFHVGADFTKILSWTESKPWLGDNAMKDAIAFSKKTPRTRMCILKIPAKERRLTSST